MSKFIIRISPPAVANKVKHDLFQRLDIYDDAFTTHHLRPKNSKDFSIETTFNESQTLTALVIQGPIIKDENFTLESICFYKKIFENHLIIVSTWEDTDQEILSLLNQEEVTVILSKKPNYSGPLNINLQIESAKAGILKAKEMGAEFVYKSRTDQRMYRNLTGFLIALQQNFPIKSDLGQTSRIIACSFTTLKYRPYGIGDMLMFGHISDMQDYWDSQYDMREIPSLEHDKLSIVEYGRIRLAETYLCTNYLLKKGYNLKWSIEDSWRVYSEMFCVVDAEMFDLFWFKYDWRIEKRFHYYRFNTMQCLKFSDWLEIKNNWNQLIIDESILQKREGEYI